MARPGADESGTSGLDQLARLRLDLHDGPQQDVVLLAEDLRLFASQLEAVLDGHPHRRVIVGRLEDLQARLVALDGDLRRISASLEAPFLQAHSFPAALAQLTGTFEARTAIMPTTTLTGELEAIADAPRVALLSLIREALNNIREHSRARHVTIAVEAGEDRVSATVSDDGIGFDPEVALVKAAREGHLGLVGMHERVRMLGGTTQIDSRPGGPTVISVSVPRRPYSPADAEESP